MTRALILAALCLSLGAPVAVAQDVPPSPPLPASDGDADGVAHVFDRCPATPAGGKPLHAGCSVADLLADPGPLALMLREGLEARGGAVGKALAATAGRPACASTTSLKRVITGAPATERRLAASRRRANASPGRALGASRTLDIAVSVAERLAGECAKEDVVATAPTRVTAIDADRATARLANGTTVLLTAAKVGTGVIPGAVVRVKGQRYGKLVVATSVLLEDVSSAAGACRFALKVQPVQQPGTPPVAHDVLGYVRGPETQDPEIVLEQGMGLTATPGPECDGTYARYALDVGLRAKDKTTTSRYLGTLTGAAGEPPVRMPVSPVKDPVLDLQVLGLPCSPGATCRTAKRLGTQSIRLHLSPTGQLALLRVDPIYDDADEPGGTPETGRNYGPGSDGLSPVLPHPANGTRVVGRGYLHDPFVDDVHLPGYPTVSLVSQINEGNDQFQVFEDVPTVLAPTGLLAAQAIGTRNGAPFAYVARLKEVVTDRVSECPGQPDTFYEMPWPKGERGVVLSARPNGEAFDVRLKDGSRVLAARGGIVTDRFSHKGRRAVRVEHQDGTALTYTGLIADAVGVGEEVDRGTHLGTLPVLGASADPTLGVSLEDAAGLAEPARWSWAIPGSAHPCHVPRRDDDLTSQTDVAPDDGDAGDVPR